MSPTVDPAGAGSRLPGGGALAANVVGFVRLLRSSGVSCGAHAAADALRALEAVGLGRRDDVFWALHAVLLTRHEDHEVFRRAFALWWSGAAERSGLPPGVGGPPAPPPPDPPAGARRVLSDREARVREDVEDERPEAVEVAWSRGAVSRTRDFEQMSREEWALARAAVTELRPRLPLRLSRRREGHPRGALLDLRRTLRASARSGHGAITLRRSRRRAQPRRLVLLVDVSGSMDRYARVVLLFAHTLAVVAPSVRAYTFGTHLTDVTRHLRHRDPDVALEAVGRAVTDWSGGTRIGPALGAFNRRWGRRSGGAVVLLVTDGLDREGGAGIAREARRLRRSVHRLIWLNPLLRYREFEPRAAGIRALLPEVDEHRPVHDLASLDQLVEALASL